MQREVEVEVAIIGRTAYVCMYVCCVYVCILDNVCKRRICTTEHEQETVELKGTGSCQFNSIQFKSRFR